MYADKFSPRKLLLHATQGNLGEYGCTVGKMYLDIIVNRFGVQDAANGQCDVPVFRLQYNLPGCGFRHTEQVVHLQPLFGFPHGAVEAFIEVGLVQEVHGVHLEAVQCVMGIGGGENQTAGRGKLTCQFDARRAVIYSF